MLIPQRTAWGRPLSPASGASAAQSILDVCSARDLAPVPHAPWRRFQDPGISPILADTRSVSLCRCGESGPQVHPAGSLQPVHQVQELGVTADVETTAGTCAPPSGEVLGGPPRGGHPPPPPHPSWPPLLAVALTSSPTGNAGVCTLVLVGGPASPGRQQVLSRRLAAWMERGARTSPWEGRARPALGRRVGHAPFWRNLPQGSPWKPGLFRNKLFAALKTLKSRRFLL